MAICEGTRNAGQRPSEGPQNEKKNTGSLGGAKVDWAGSVPGGGASWGPSKTCGQNRVVGGSRVRAKSLRG